MLIKTFFFLTAKGRVMGAAVIEMLTTCGLILVLLLMLLYMCGLYEEKTVGRLAAIFAYISSKYAKKLGTT